MQKTTMTIGIGMVLALASGCASVGPLFAGSSSSSSDGGSGGSGSAERGAGGGESSASSSSSSTSSTSSSASGGATSSNSSSSSSSSSSGAGGACVEDRDCARDGGYQPISSASVFFAWSYVPASAIGVTAIELDTTSSGVVYLLADTNESPGAELAHATLAPGGSLGFVAHFGAIALAAGKRYWIGMNAQPFRCDGSAGDGRVYHTCCPTSGGGWADNGMLPSIPFRVLCD